ncbi:MAG: four helix bundle protein [Bacteroidales bacterium]|nr:four helix bundle protein [Bacteroidales bacterium]MDE6263175.1 four helix bundle protein [Muribaculaceae bacterium]
MYRFENLDVWQRARKLTYNIYSITRDFPREELHGITSQLRRASVSVCSNIAEGNGRLFEKEQKHFYSISVGSLYEILCQLIISNDLGFIDDLTLQTFRSEIDIIGRQLSKLSAATEKKQ